MFTAGSATFLVADTWEWWKNNRVGCFYYDHLKDDYEAAEGKFYGDIDTVKGKCRRMEKGLNFFCSLIGSFLYLVGSLVMFPTFDSNTQSLEFYIIASFIIFASQSWKVCRQGCSNSKDVKDTSFRLSNYSTDLLGLGVDACAGIGGLLYGVGSIYFLPEYDTSDTISFYAAVIFVCGGFFFFSSGVFMYFRYFCA